MIIISILFMSQHISQHNTNCIQAESGPFFKYAGYLLIRLNRLFKRNDEYEKRADSIYLNADSE